MMSTHVTTLLSITTIPILAQESISIHGTRTHCDTDPCHNGGICRMNAGDGDTRGFSCECPPDWTGVFCDVPYPKVTCGEGEISVQIDKRLVTDHGLDESQQRVSFLDSENENCHAVSDGDNYRLTIKSPFGSCGTTTTRQDNDDYTFSNKVIWKKVYPGQEGEADIAREIILLDFRCEYEDEYLLHLVPIKPLETTVDQETSKGDFRIKMGLFKDRTFVEDRKLPENPIVAIDEEVCVQMSLVNSLGIDNLVLTVKDCWTSASLDSAEKHMLIEKKCEAENEYSVDVIYNGISDRTQFCFHMFKWSDKMDEVFLQCEVNVCDSSVTTRGFSQCQCPPQGFNLNDWIYPNYYNSMFDYYDKSNDYVGGDGMYADDAGYYYDGNAYYYDYQPPDAEESEPVERKRRRRRAVGKKQKAFDIQKDQDGNIVLPKGIRTDSLADIIDIALGPIHIVPQHGNQSALSKNRATVTVYNVTDEGPWFEDPDNISASQNIVLIAVGIALLMAMVILGVVIGAYVQCKKKWDRRSQKIRELSKVREFYQGVLRPGQASGMEAAANIEEAAKKQQSLPAFIKNEQ